ncbi:Ectonucleotide pyrophosphatase/phosphodiesterase family member 7 [Oryzias melastigma]|uniref:Ectonucleotide pyrophosphatase/phosphodiesterase family member 7 n=1 Tax=Oryzias melastigma TaxID=30732 RepID=A0A3B3BHE9_ORYME|nr:ectonucleotide pyrophosphatase/phosphodiesterase family member 7 [Oryzias melastigma]XP_024114192.1 ectonucleotide pyrophosphatase/phosphodiesterase family member 7 [Oryzias melastigma]XP_024114193.1 ectonucleotide pyrophosphatase/phosphodiesterase family member 7 [Oryzias melastigma]KAF6737604.1 Ectonucleotide pyrophosphatase/phosphodiesterase family member 7 [Oryzias melastigma]
MRLQVLLLLTAAGCAVGRSLRKSAEKQLLLISFDGFRWDYDQDVDTPNLDQLVVDGVKAKYITPPMLTMTSPSHFTTITGRWVEDHEVVHNMMFNTTTNLKVPHKQTLSRSEWWDTGVLPLWITAQNQGLKTASFFFPGGGANYSGQSVNRVVMEEAGFPDDNETEWQQNIDTVLSWFSQENFNLVTLYYGEPDNVGHAKGPDHPRRKEIIQQIDRTIGYLRTAIHRHQLTDSLDVIITSDHGMTTVKKRPLVDEIVLNKYLNLLKLTSFEILDYGGFGILTPRPGMEQEVFDALSKAPNLTVYKKHEMPDSFHLGKSERLPPIVVIADLGFNLNSRFIVYVNKGDHGFHNDHMDMKTIFRAFGPSFKKNFLSEPFDSIHIYPLMCKLLQIEPAPHNGSLAVTEDMLQSAGTRGAGLSVWILLLSLLSRFTVL